MIFISESTAACVCGEIRQKRQVIGHSTICPIAHRGVEEVLGLEVAVADIVHCVAILDGAQHVADDQRGVLRTAEGVRGC